MSVKIEPFLAMCRGEQIDTGIDAIVLCELGVETQIGVIGRDRNAPIQLFEDGMAPSIVKECQRAAAERDARGVPDEHVEAALANVREVQEPPPAIEEDEQDDDDYEE